MANELLDIFEKMDMKIQSAPKDIEELTSIKDFMANVPMEIEKLATDIKNAMGVYDILDYFGYKFSDDDDFDKKWRVFGSPSDTLKKISVQQGYLDREKDKFISQMQGQQ
mmetsp:Transcript_9535/g.9123  ORF Transcript_9535/g.9123 Transcript_9535/m.9123 type:complete len:110 (-) Transcript_9535:2427-2756(-)